jgi:large subunit ribosomal protein L4
MPHWRGGGVALGPKPRSYAQRTPKKMIRLALYSALSDRAADEKVLVVDGWSFEAPSTKAAVAALEAINATGKVLVVLGADDEIAAKSFRNLGHVHVLAASELNAYDVLVSDYVVFTRDTLPAAKPTGKDDKRHSVAADTGPAAAVAAEEESA